MRAWALVVLELLAGCGSEPVREPSAAAAVGVYRTAARWWREPHRQRPQARSAGDVRQSFGAIDHEGQRGAPSFASIVDVPAPGCWRLSLRSGALRGAVTVRAIDR